MATKRSKTIWVAGSAPLENFGSHSERNNSTASTTSQSSCVIVTSESCDSDSEYPDVNVLPSFAHISTEQSFIHEDSDFPAVNEQPNFAQEDSDFPDVDALPPMSNSCPDADYAPPDEQPPSIRPFLGRQSRSYENQDNQITSHVFRSANQQEDSRRELRSAAISIAAERYR